MGQSSANAAAAAGRLAEHGLDPDDVLGDPEPDLASRSPEVELRHAPWRGHVLVLEAAPKHGRCIMARNQLNRLSAAIAHPRRIATLLERSVGELFGDASAVASRK
jgi:hypothetical protein